MKKPILCAVLGLSLVLSSAHILLRAGDGGESFFGGFAGSMLGSAITSKGSSGPSRAEIEAQRAQDKAEALRREQDRREIDSLKRQIQEQQGGAMGVTFMPSSNGGQSPLTYIMILFLLLSALGVAGMAYMLFRKQKEHHSSMHDQKGMR